MSNLFHLKLITSTTSQQKEVYTEVISRHHHRKLFLKSTGNERSVGINYLTAPYYNSDNVLHIDNKYSLIDRNIPRAEEKWALIQGSSNFKSPYRFNLITHVFYNDASNPNAGYPLFYKHKLKLSADKYSTIISSSVKVVNKNFKPVPDNRWVFSILYKKNVITPSDPLVNDEIDELVLYSNFEGKYYERTGEHEVYYVTYTLSSGEQFTELVDNQPIYYRKTISTYNYKFTYSLTEAGDWFNISVNYPAKKYAIKPAKSSRLYLEGPNVKEHEEHWAPKINAGVFITSVEGKSYKYEIKEHLTGQNYYPTYPYKLAGRIPAQIITRNLLRSPITPLAHGNGLTIDIIVKNRKGELKYAFTTNDNKTYYVDKDPRTSKVLTTTYVNIKNQISFDRLGGFIYLGPYFVEPDDLVFLNSFYEETGYALDEIELNPMLNRNILERTLVVFCQPVTKTDEDVITHTIHWFYLDKYGQVVIEEDVIVGSSNMPSWLQATLEDPTFNYIQFLYNNASSKMFYTVSYEDINLEVYNGEIYSYEMLVPPYEGSIVFSAQNLFQTDRTSDLNTIELFTLNSNYGDYTVIGNTLYVKISPYSDFENQGYITYQFVPSNTRQLLLLGELTAGQPFSPSSLDSIDIRIRGGGIKEDQEASAALKQEEIDWYWDIGFWDGKPLPGAAVARIFLPWYHRTEVQEELTTNEYLIHAQTQEIVNQHLAVGVYPLLRAWGPMPTIIDYEVGIDSITCELSDEDEETGLVNYFVYYKKLEETEDNSLSTWSQVKCTNREALLEGLNPDTIYLLRPQCTASIDGSNFEEVPNETIYKIQTLPAVES